MIITALIALYILGAVVFLCAIMLAAAATMVSPHIKPTPAWGRITVSTIFWPLASIAILFIVLAKVSRT